MIRARVRLGRLLTLPCHYSVLGEALPMSFIAMWAGRQQIELYISDSQTAPLT